MGHYQRPFRPQLKVALPSVLRKMISTNCLFSRKKFDTHYLQISLPQIRLVSKMYQFLHRARALNFNYRQTHIDSYSECQMKIKIIGQKLPNSKVTDSKSSLKIPSIFFGESQIIAIFFYYHFFLTFTVLFTTHYKISMCRYNSIFSSNFNSYSNHGDCRVLCMQEIV